MTTIRFGHIAGRHSLCGGKHWNVFDVLAFVREALVDDQAAESGERGVRVRR